MHRRHLKIKTGILLALTAAVQRSTPDGRLAMVGSEKNIADTGAKGPGVLDGCIAHQLPSGLLYDKITEPNFEETTLPCMLAFTIYKGVKSGWLDGSYLVPADKMRTAAHANVDADGLLQNASAAPRFNSPGTSTEGQAFFLMMEGAYRKLHQEGTR